MQTESSGEPLQTTRLRGNNQNNQNNLLREEEKTCTVDLVKMSSSSEKCYNPQDRTLTFVDREDDMDFLCKGYKSLRAKMSCGHAVTPMSLTDWCRRLLDQKQCRFVCGKCDVQWSFEEVRKMALLTPGEVKEFEEKRFHNASKQHLGIRECPGLEILKTCPDIVFESVRGVTGCPSIRACPTCGVRVQHDRTGCKNVVCSKCKVSFCFVCLKTTTECQKIKPYSYTYVCSSGVAPRQTSVPVRQSR